MGVWTTQRGELFDWKFIEDFNNVELTIPLYNKLLAAGLESYSTRELNKNGGNHPSGFPWWQMAAYEYLHHSGLPEQVWHGRDTTLGSDIVSRPLYANQIGAEVLVSIHSNAFQNGAAHGSRIIYDSANGYQQESQKLGEAINSHLLERLRGQWKADWYSNVRGVPWGNEQGYGENHFFNGTAVIVEVAFHDNITDNIALRDPTFRDITATAIQESIVQYLDSRAMVTVISGTVQLPGRTNFSGTDIFLSPQPCPVLTSVVTVTGTRVAVTDERGYFEINLIPAYQCLQVHHDGFLIGQHSLTLGLDLDTLILPIGDVNGDNVIDIFDLSYLAAHYKSNDLAADLNVNGVVDIFDLTLAASNYQRRGAIPWP